MPAFGVLLLLAQVACAVHVVRTGRPYYWIYIVVFVPMVGMAAYLIAELLPDLMGSRTARHAASGMGRAIDPGRGLREAQRRAQMTPTIENKAALAEEYQRSGQPGDAAALYRETLTGIHATDPTMMLGLARALFARGRFLRDRDGPAAAARRQPRLPFARGASPLRPEPRRAGQERAGAAGICGAGQLLPGARGPLPLCPAAPAHQPRRRGSPLFRGNLPIGRIRAAAPAPRPVRMVRAGEARAGLSRASICQIEAPVI